MIEPMKSTASHDQGTGHPGVDMDLYSRQLGTYGLETMTKLVNAKYLISGMQGVGAEIAKNLILAGPGRVTISDMTIVDASDLSSNFCLTEKSIGRETRAAASLKFLQELNPYVCVDVCQEVVLSVETLSQYDCVILCNYSKAQLGRIAEICNSKDVKYIAVNMFGLCCSVFVDFGPSFIVTDTDGEEPRQSIIDSIVYDVGTAICTINCPENKRVSFSVGDFVSFAEVEGFEGFNGIPFKVTSVGKYSFQVVAPALIGRHQKGGIATQVKQPKILEFRSYSESCLRPVPDGQIALASPDLAKFGRSEQLHIAFQAMLDYVTARESLPEPRDAEETAKVYKFACDLNKRMLEQRQFQGVCYVEQVDENVVKNLCYFAACHFQPLATFIGGIVAQEAVKITGKYHPIHQWFYFDCFELLENLADVSDFVPAGNRYDDLVTIWGHTNQKKISELRLFLVGAGALGCEYAKNLGLLGCCTSASKGLLTVTDMDKIETSNLNRQFLFRREHIGESKSLTAGMMVKHINPELKVQALETRVGVETENVFTDQFWDQLDVVINALDNIPSRLYVDQKCLWHEKPLLESGTLGVKGNVQVILPFMTESYGDARDPPEESIPMCTLRHFPNQIEHTIEWARDYFQGTFFDAVKECQNIHSDAQVAFEALIAQCSPGERRLKLQRVLRLLKLAVADDPMGECIKWAVEQFHELFHNYIAQLLHSFPSDSMTKEGAPFWSGSKRCPTLLELNLNDTTHRTFVVAAANICGEALGVPRCRDVGRIATVAAQIPLQPFVPAQLTIKTSEEEDVVEGSADDHTISNNLQQEILRLMSQLKSEVKAVEFEKDDDTNYHIDFMWSAGNLRARNYNIKEIERWRAKVIAGKIIPAIASTTAMVTGLATIEFLKAVLQDSKSPRPIEHFKNSFVHLAEPLWILSEPGEPKKNKDKEYDEISMGPVRARPLHFTSWDKLKLQMAKTATLQQLINRIQTEMNTEVSLISHGNISIYNSFMPSGNDKVSKSLSQLAEELYPGQSKTVFPLEASCTDEDGVDVNIPRIKLILA